MTKPSFRNILLASLALALPLTAPLPASAQFAVIDTANLGQNILLAGRSLQQINNQITALQNQVTMIQSLGKNLSTLNFSSLSAIANDLQQIGTLMNHAQGINFTLSAVQSAYAQRYPQTYTSGVALPQVVTDAQSRWKDAQSAFQQTLLVQSQITQTVQSDTAKLSQLVTASQGSVGNLQVTQATNQLLALLIKQEIQLQTLLAAQGRAQALNGAGAIQADAEGQAAFTTFLGSGAAYTPQ